jgi:hypothetical protein
LAKWKRKHLRSAISIWRHFQSRGPEISSGAGHILQRQGLENTIVSYDKCLNKFWDCIKNRGLMSKNMRMLFLSPLISIRRKRKENLLPYSLS